MRRIFALALPLFACATSLEVPDDVRVVCDDDSDCLGGLCATAVGYCVDALDEDPVHILGATAAGPSSVLVSFDDALDPGSTGDPSRYVIQPPLEVTFAAYDDVQHAVLVATSEQAPGVTYSIGVSGITDEQGNGLADDGRTATFVSFFGAADDSPPRPIAPATGALLREAEVLLQWSGVTAAGGYTVEISTDPLFVTGVESHSIQAPITALTFTAAEALTYHWRVRANVTKANVWATANFNRLDDIVYVGCGAPACPGGVGNRTKPLASLAEAMALAQGSDIHELRLRGGATPHVGPLVIDDYALTVRGGYDATFENRDTAANPSVILGLGSAAIVACENETVVFDGLVFEASATSNTVVVQLRSSKRVDFDDVLVRSSGDDETKVTSVVGILDETPANPFGPPPDTTLNISDSVVEMGSGAEVVGIRATNVDVDLQHVTVRPRPAAAANHATNVFIRGDLSSVAFEDVHLVGQSVLAGNAPRSALGMACCLATVRHSTFEMPAPVGSPAGFSWSGLDMSGSKGVLERSTILSEVGVASVEEGWGLRSLSDIDLLMRDNVIVVVNGVGYRPDSVRALYDGYAGTNGMPASFVDNTVVIDTVGTAIFSTTLEGVDITNNILVAPLCVSEDGSTVGMDLLKHHNYYGNAFACPNLLDRNDGQPVVTSIATLNGYYGQQSYSYCLAGYDCSQNQHTELNFTVADPTTLFVSNTGPLASRNLHLAAGAPLAVRQSAVDSTTSTCGYVVATVHDKPCRGGAADRGDVGRSAPRSVGAYEF